MASFGGARRRSQMRPETEPFDQSELCRALDGISADGSFASGERLEPVDLDIAVRGVGPIRSPLSEAQARQIIARGRRAPFGKGSATVVDTAVRNTWELDPEQFEIGNARWRYHLDGILVRAAAGLGITESVRAELYKMLLYEKGAMFKAHVDTEKIPGMFGTLVISLPSSHEGGEVIVKHHNRAKTYTTSEHEMSYLSWYSDISHEVLPVKSGYRWVLTYNLALHPAENKPDHAVDTFLRDDRELRRILGSWAKEVHGGQRPPSPLCYVLGHKCSDLKFDLVLATLERVDRGTTEPEYDRYDRYNRYGRYGWDEDEDEDEYGDGSDGNGHHDIDELLETSYAAKFIFDLAGRKIRSSKSIKEGDILQEDPFGEEPDGEDYEGYMGNSGPEATHWYRLSALVMVPPKGAISFLAERVWNLVTSINDRDNDFRAVANYFIDRCIKWPRYDIALDEFHHLLRCASSQRLFAFDGDLLQRALQASINTPELFHLLLTRNTQPVPIGFITWLRKEYDLSNITLETLEKRFLSIIILQRVLGQQEGAISALIGDAGDPDALEPIISRAVDEALKITDSTRLCDPDDLALFDISLYHKGFYYLKTTVVPVVAKRSNSTGFVLEFLRALLQSIRRRQVPQEEAMAIYEHLALLTLQNLKLASLTVCEPLAAQQEKLKQTFEVATVVTNFVDYDSFLGFISSLFQFGFMKHMDIFLATINREAAFIRGESFNSLWIPFLIDLIAMLERYNASLTAPCWQVFYQSILTAYLTNYVSFQPLGDDLKRKTVTCYSRNCRDCSSLNAFLANGAAKTAGFPLSKQRRQHLHQQLDNAGIACTHETDRRTRPETLVVTKTRTKSQAVMSSWTERMLVARDSLKAFNQDKLRTLLADRYESIMQLEVLSRRSVPYTPPAYYAQPTQSRAPPPISLERQLARVEAEMLRLANPRAPGAHHPRPPPNPQPSTASRLAPASSSVPNPGLTRQRSASLRVPGQLTWHAAIAPAAPSRPPGTPSGFPGVAPARPANGSNAPPPAYATTMTPRPAASVKRKVAEVIDLTGDDG